ncbi:hypothetical protein ACIOHH_33520 [Streptomyces microflavus]|uniref:hypothetical protein n=1 Tax=Streptomyces microflavus TaxID=1919 RepID=UPI00382F153B
MILLSSPQPRRCARGLVGCQLPYLVQRGEAGGVALPAEGHPQPPHHQGDHEDEVRKWADTDPHFGRAYQAVVRYAKEFAVSRRSRANLVPERATKLFALLEAGRYSVAGASTEIGISEGVVYARRKRDQVFAARLQQAQERGQAAREAAEEESSACLVSKP